MTCPGQTDRDTPDGTLRCAKCGYTVSDPVTLNECPDCGMRCFEYAPKPKPRPSMADALYQMGLGMMRASQNAARAHDAELARRLGVRDA